MGVWRPGQAARPASARGWSRWPEKRKDCWDWRDRCALDVLGPCGARILALISDAMPTKNTLPAACAAVLCALSMTAVAAPEALLYGALRLRQR